MKQRLHWALTITALVVALLGTTPLGSATVRNGLAAAKEPLYATHVLSRGPRGPRGRRGPRGYRGLQGLQGPQGLQGIQGATGAPGSALAYALVNGDATINSARSKNVVAVKHATICQNGTTICSDDAGFYCFKLMFVPKNAVATALYTGDYKGDVKISATVDPPSTFPTGGAPYTSSCPVGFRSAFVYIWAKDTSSQPVDYPFYVAFN